MEDGSYYYLRPMQYTPYVPHYHSLKLVVTPVPLEHSDIDTNFLGAFNPGVLD